MEVREIEIIKDELEKLKRDLREKQDAGERRAVYRKIDRLINLIIEDEGKGYVRAG